MNRSILRIMNENNINQIYISNALNKTKNTFLKNVTFCDYQDKRKNTLFIGMYNINDFNYVKSHKGKKYILWSDNIIELSSIKISFIKSIKLDYHYCLKNNVYNCLKNLLPNIICLDKEFFNIKLVEFVKFIKVNEISQLFVSINSEIFNNKLMKYKLNSENTLFWGLDPNNINIIKNHVGKKWIFYDNKFEIISNKLKNLVNSLPNVEGHLCINYSVYENIKNFFNNVTLIKYFDINSKKNFNLIENKILKENCNVISSKKSGLIKRNISKVNAKENILRNSINTKKSEPIIKKVNKVKAKEKVLINCKSSKKPNPIINKKNYVDGNLLRKNNQPKVENNVINNKCQLFKSYPLLFNKYLLKIVNPNKNIFYEVKNENKDDNFINNKYFAHLHCFNIKNFNEIYSNYIDKINKYFSIIVTYSIGKEDISDKYTLLRIENRGMDVGAKFCVTEYLNRNNIKFDYILFLHSKSNLIKRNNYFDSLVNNIPYFFDKINLSKNIGAFVPPLILNGSNGYFLNNNLFHNNLKLKNNWGNNSIYMNDFIKYFGLDNRLFLFPEGNCYILQNKVINLLYTDKLIYNLLNTQRTFDYSWVKNAYKFLDKEGPDKIYKKYLHLNLIPNNLNTSTKSLFYLADSMIEHTYERMIFLFLKKLDLDLEIFFNFDKHTNNNYNNIINRYIKSNNTLYNFSNLENKNENNNIILIACHTNSQLKVYSLIYNLNFFTKIARKIIIINSKELIHLNLERQIIKHYHKGFIEDNNITFKYYDNDCYLCQGKWFYCLNEISYSNYTNIILTNDSYILYNSLNYFENIWDNDIEMSTILTSSEKKKHDTDFLRRYNQEGIRKIINYYKKNINTSKKNLTYKDVIETFEINSSDIFESKNNLYFEKDDININFEDEYLSEYLLKKNYPIIKIKKILKSNKIDFISHILKNKRFNFLNF